MRQARLITYQNLKVMRTVLAPSAALSGNGRSEVQGVGCVAASRAVAWGEFMTRVSEATMSHRCGRRSRVHNAQTVALVLLFLVASTTALANVRLPMGASTGRTVNAFSRAARLPPLGSRGRELRVWIWSVMTGSIDGFVITEEGIAHCVTAFEIGTRDTLKWASCKPDLSPDVAHRALALAPRLAHLEGQYLNCGTEDGDEVIVEGTSSRGKFTVTAMNPWSCKDTNFRLVEKLLRVLGWQ